MGQDVLDRVVSTLCGNVWMLLYIRGMFWTLSESGTEQDRAFGLGSKWSHRVVWVDDVVCCKVFH